MVYLFHSTFLLPKEEIQVFARNWVGNGEKQHVISLHPPSNGQRSKNKFLNLLHLPTSCSLDSWGCHVPSFPLLSPADSQCFLSLGPHPSWFWHFLCPASKHERSVILCSIQFFCWVLFVGVKGVALKGSHCEGKGGGEEAAPQKLVLRVEYLKDTVGCLALQTLFSWSRHLLLLPYYAKWVSVYSPPWDTSFALFNAYLCWCFIWLISFTICHRYYC